MNHQHIKPPETELLAIETSDDGSNNSDSEPIQKRTAGDVNPGIQDGTTGLIPKEEEICIETICMDIDGEDRTSDNSSSVRSDIKKVQGVDQEKLLNSTFSGVDLGMVHKLLETQPYEKNPLEALNNDVKSIHIKEKIDSSGIIPEEIPNSTDHGSNVDTEVVSSQNMEFNSMRDYVDNSRKTGVGSISESDGNIRNGTFYETNGHVFDCYIENDISGMHNSVDAERGETIISASADDVTAKEFDSGSEDTRKGIFNLSKKSSQKFRAIDESVKRIIRDYPLISEFEIGEHLKDIDEFSNAKLDKKGIVKILKRLRLESSYERFRYFVKA